MAKFRCRSYGELETFVYDGRHKCPDRGSVDVQFTLGIEELPDDAPLIEAMRRLVEQDDNED
ncbi:hypothetical protein [Bradyrhizobium embrapense]